MTLLHQAAQKAVEALNHIVRRLQMDIDDGGRPDQWSMEDLVRKAQPAIDAVQSALQQPEQATEPAWGITPATLNRHVSPGITLGHELNRLRQYDAAALQHQEEPREPVAWPPEVIAWRDARREYVEALERYNTRLAAIRAREAQFPHEFGHDNPEAEYHAYTDAQNRAHRLLGPMYEALMAASPSTTRQQEVGIFDKTGERINALAKEAGFHMEPMTNMLYTVRGNHAQLVNFARLVLAAAPSTPESGVSGADAGQQP